MSNETSFPRLEDVAVLEHGVNAYLLTIDLCSALFDQPFRVPTALRKLRLYEDSNQVGRIGHASLGDIVWDLVLAELQGEVLLRASRRLCPMQPLDDLARQGGLRVPRFHRQDLRLLFRIHA